MRVKQVWDYLPLPAKLKLAWDRLTFSRLTTAYLIFSVVHCIIQVALQIRAFTINANAASFMYGISLEGNATDSRVPVLNGDQFYLCPDVPLDGVTLSDCEKIWDANGKSKNGTQDDDAKATSAGQEAYPSSSSSAVLSASVTASRATTSSIASVISSTFTSSAAAPSATEDDSDDEDDDGNFGARPVVTITVTPSRVVTPPKTTSASVPLSTTSAIAPPATVPTIPSSQDHKEEELDDESDDESSDDDGSESDDDESDDDFELEKRFIPILVAQPDGSVQLNTTVDGDALANPVTLSRSCLWALNWPVSILSNTKREDIVFITFQFWVLGMSTVALLNESIPHIIASLLTHLLATGWSAFQIYHTNRFKSNFNHLITNGACKGAALLGSYWDQRARVEYPSLALNFVALLVSAFLSWRLFKAFGWQTFKRVGASLTINRVYKLVLSLSIVLQLSLFFMGATVALWIDNLFNGVASTVAWYIPLYKATSFVTIVLLIPWIATGWFAVRKELRIPMFVFLLLSILYLAALSVMFLAPTFRWAYITWQFFGIITTISVVLTVAALVLGIICRYNFGKGLPRYLNAQEPLPGDDFTPVWGPNSAGTGDSDDIEKFAFPSNEKPIPTYSATFGKGAEVPPPSQMFAARVGPRFMRGGSSEPFETPSTRSIASTNVSPPPPAMTRPDEWAYGGDDVTLVRSNSVGSQKSLGARSMASYYSYSDNSHSRNESTDTARVGGRRWVIE